MVFIKIIILIGILISCVCIGNSISKRFISRVNDLIDMKKALNILETKIKFTYEPLPQVFLYISKNVNDSISQIFKNSAKKMEKESAGSAWKDALEKDKTNLKQEDLEILKSLGNLLGKTDIDGQVSEIELVNRMLDVQINKAEEDKTKYVKMYRSLGIYIGLAIIVVLI